MTTTAMTGIIKTALAFTMLAVATPENTGGVVAPSGAGHVSLSLTPQATKLKEFPFFGCQNCSNECPEPIRHEAEYHPWGEWRVPVDAAHTPHDHDCFGKNAHGRCSDNDNHTRDCVVEQDADLVAVLEEMLSSDPARVMELASQPANGRVQLNLERSAIQVWGCGDKLVAHIPVVLLEE